MFIMGEGQTSQTRAQTMLGVLVLVLCLAAGGGAFYWFVLRDDSSGVIVIPGNANAAPAGQTNYAARSILPAPDGGLVVRGKGLIMRVPKTPGSAEDLHFRYNRGDMLRGEDRRWADAAWRISRDTAVAAYVNATSDQVDRLKQITAPPINVKASERQHLLELWSQYVNAADGTDKTKTQTELLTALNEIGTRELPAVKQRVAEELVKIKTILTPDQFAAFKQMDSERPRPPGP
jgi:hypothetical protein